jgi:ABC-type multidrug transport system fused ATPase/permease subunit
MKQGRIVEIGTPYNLIEKNGIFTEMVQHTGKNATIITAKAL